MNMITVTPPTSVLRAYAAPVCKQLAFGLKNTILDVSDGYGEEGQAGGNSVQHVYGSDF